MKALLALLLFLPFISWAEKTTPSDFFCRALTGTAAASALQGQAMAWNPEIKAAWDASPALQRELTQFVTRQDGTPHFYRTGAGACAAAGAAGTGICQQSVECAVIPKSKQKDVEKRFKESTRKTLPFSAIDARSKEALLTELHASLQWNLSSVTCGARSGSANGVPVCPSPDTCKGDVETEGATAMTDPSLTLTPLGAGSAAPGSDTSGGLGR